MHSLIQQFFSSRQAIGPRPCGVHHTSPLAGPKSLLYTWLIRSVGAVARARWPGTGPHRASLPFAGGAG
jgi:hypothetical protein